MSSYRPIESKSRRPHPPQDDLSDVDPYPGRVLGGRFILVSRRIGSQESYLAYDTVDGRTVEVLIGTQSELSGFRALVQTSAAIDHPRVLSYLAWGVHLCDSSVISYVVFEFLPSAISLDLYRALRGPLKSDEIDAIAADISEAIEACRAQNVALEELRMQDILITSMPGWPRTVKLRVAPPRDLSGKAICSDDVRELELPIFEEGQRTGSVRASRRIDLAEIIDKLR